MDKRGFRPYVRRVFQHTHPQSGRCILRGGGNIPRQMYFDEATHPDEYIQDALEQIPEGIPAFGQVIGFVIHWNPHEQSRYNPHGLWR